MKSVNNLMPVMTKRIMKIKNTKRKVVLFLWMLSKEHNGKFISRYGLWSWVDEK